MFRTCLLNAMYLAAILVAGPWIAIVRWSQKKSVASWPARFWGTSRFDHMAPPSSIWFHAVSVGEVNLLTTIIEKYRQRECDLPVLITTSTDSGYKLARQKFPDDAVEFFPWDFSWAIRRFIARHRPVALVLAELEIWPNLLRLVKQHGMATAVVNGRLSEKSLRGYRRFRWVTQNTFARLDRVLAQSDADAKRFVAAGVQQSRVTSVGSIKFDSAKFEVDSKSIEHFRRLADITESQPVFVAGSTQSGEDEIILDAYLVARRTVPDLRLVIAPRHPHRAESVAELCAARSLKPVLRTSVGTLPPGGSGAPATGEGRPDSPSEGRVAEAVLIVDTIGELLNWWSIADIAFVGGSLGNRGGQNMIEPAALGVSVCFGPNTRNFRDVVQQFVAVDSVCVVHNADDIADFIIWTQQNPTASAAMTNAAITTILTAQGACDKTIDALESLFG